MAYYRLYFLQGSRIIGVEEIDAGDDTIAMQAARAFVGENGLELWCERRKVGRIEPDDLGSQLVANRRARREAPDQTEQEQAKTA